MLLIPAIDLKQGKCVRLRQGRMQDETVFSDDPVAMAQRWYDAGAKRLHVVDLDGPVQAKPINQVVVQKITAALPDFSIQIGGGIRHESSIRAYLDAGVDYVIIGSKAAESPEFIAQACANNPGRVIGGIDVRNGLVAVDAWARQTDIDAIGLAQQLAQMGVAAIVYTDISKDGMMQGVNIEATLNLARQISVPVIASGGVSNMHDVENLYAVADQGIMGAIIGRALYQGDIDLAKAIAWLEQHSDKNPWL